MSLREDIEAFQREFLARVPDDVVAVMQGATDRLVRSGLAERALKAGDPMPSFALPNTAGSILRSGPLLARGPLVVSFYRGGWCPYCSLELRALQRALPVIHAMGGELVAISPQMPDHSLATARELELGFEVLSDVGNAVARRFGLVFSLPEELRPIYQQFGIDIPAHNGDATYELPIPATYVVGQDGIIVHAFVDADYTRRMEPEVIAGILQALTAEDRA